LIPFGPIGPERAEEKPMIPRRSRTRTRRRWVAAVAGLSWAGFWLVLLPVPAARAQYSYGYDSWVYGYMPSQAWWRGAGYSQIYTDPTNGVYPNGTLVPPRTVAPYQEPPFGTFGRGNALAPGYAANGAPLVTAPPVPPAQRRGVIRRIFRRR
jgi:hypothetical protein